MIIQDTLTSEMSTYHSFSREAGRKFFHLTILLLPFCYHILHFSLELIISGFLVIILLFIPIEIFRLKYPNFFLNQFMRRIEEKNIAGYVPTTMVWLLVTLGAYWNYYPFEYAEAAIISTIMGDAMAALIGKRIGKNRLIFTEKKTVEGAIAGFGTTWLIAGVFLALTEISNALFISLAIGIVFFLTDLRENLPTELLSDNILNPIFGTIAAILIAELLVII